MRKLLVAVLVVGLLGVFCTGCLFGGNQNPEAKIKQLPAVVNTGVVVTFDGSESKDPDGSISNYTWDLGDGTTNVYGSIITHKYTQWGLKNIKLSVNDNNGATGTASTTITVNYVPVVSVEITPLPRHYGNYTDSTGNPLNFYYADEEITFDASGTADQDSANLTFAWDFGDTSNSTSGQKVTTHRYMAGGVYNVSLSVNDGYAASNYSTMLMVQDLQFTEFNFTSYVDINTDRRVNFTTKIINNGIYDKEIGSVVLYLETFVVTKVDGGNTTNSFKIAAGSTMNKMMEVNAIRMSNANTYVRATLFWHGIMMDEEIRGF